MVTRIPVRPSARRKARHSSSAQARSAQRCAIFVKICNTVAPMASARSGASCVPPATETWAPRRSAVKVAGSAPERAPATRAVQGGALIAILERVIERAPALALVLQRVVPADDAVHVRLRVMAEASADRASLDDAYLLLSHTAGSMAGPPWRISKCRCGGSSGSDMPTVPIVCPFCTVTPSRTSARAREP